MCLRNISKDFPVDDMKQTGLNEYLYHFLVAYGSTGVVDILDIHNYLKKKIYNINFDFIKQVFVTLLSAWTTVTFGGSLAPNSKRHKICISKQSKMPS